MKNTFTKVLFVCLVVAVMAGLFIWRSRLNHKQPLNNLGVTSEESGSTSPYALDESANQDTSGGKPVVSSPPKPNQGISPRLIVSPPDLSKPIVIKADVSEALKKDTRAKIEALQKGLRNNPSYYDAWLALGVYRKLLGDYDGAAEAWRYAGTLRPDRYVAFSNLGDLYHSYIKDFSKAEEFMKKAIAADPTYVPSYRNLHELYRYSFKEKESLAVDILLEGMKKNPQAYDLMTMLASYYKDKNDKGNARKYYQMAIALNPPNKTEIETELNTLK